MGRLCAPSRPVLVKQSWRDLSQISPLTALHEAPSPRVAPNDCPLTPALPRSSDFFPPGEVQPVTVAGESFTGPLALTLGTRHPKAVDNLIIVNRRARPI